MQSFKICANLNGMKNFGCAYRLFGFFSFPFCLTVQAPYALEWWQCCLPSPIPCVAKIQTC